MSVAITGIVFCIFLIACGALVKHDEAKKDCKFQGCVIAEFEFHGGRMVLMK